MKRYSTLLFSAEFSLAEEQGLEKKLRKLFGKGRRRKMSRKAFKISQKLFKDVLKVIKVHVKVLLL